MGLRVRREISWQHKSWSTLIGAKIQSALPVSGNKLRVNISTSYRNLLPRSFLALISKDVDISGIYYIFPHKPPGDITDMYALNRAVFVVSSLTPNYQTALSAAIFGSALLSSGLAPEPCWVRWVTLLKPKVPSRPQATCIKRTQGKLRLPIYSSGLYGPGFQSPRYRLPGRDITSATKLMCYRDTIPQAIRWALANTRQATPSSAHQPTMFRVNLERILGAVEPSWLCKPERSTLQLQC